MQIFPLAILPGTDFRKRSRELGLRFDPHPPYTVIATPTFAPRGFPARLRLRGDAASILVFFPLPDLDVSWRLRATRRAARKGAGPPRAAWEAVSYVAKLNLKAERPIAEIRSAWPGGSPSRISCWSARGSGPGLSEKRPVDRHHRKSVHPPGSRFFDPSEPPATPGAPIGRPACGGPISRWRLALLFATPGNRAVLFTLVSRDRPAAVSGRNGAAGLLVAQTRAAGAEGFGRV